MSFLKGGHRRSTKFLQNLLSLALAKFGKMKRLAVTIDNMSIQERHIFQTWPEFIKTSKMTHQNIQIARTFFYSKIKL